MDMRQWSDYSRRTAQATQETWNRSRESAERSRKFAQEQLRLSLEQQARSRALTEQGRKRYTGNPDVGQGRKRYTGNPDEAGWEEGGRKEGDLWRVVTGVFKRIFFIAFVVGFIIYALPHLSPPLPREALTLSQTVSSAAAKVVSELFSPQVARSMGLR